MPLAAPSHPTGRRGCLQCPRAKIAVVAGACAWGRRAGAGREQGRAAPLGQASRCLQVAHTPTQQPWCSFRAQLSSCQGRQQAHPNPLFKRGMLSWPLPSGQHFKLQTQGWKGAAPGPWLCVTAPTTGLCPPPAGKRIKKDFPFLFLSCFFHQSSCKRQPCLALGKGTWDCPHRTTTQSQGSHTGPSSVSLFTLRKQIHFTQGNVAIPRGPAAGTRPWFRCMFRQCCIVFLSP